MKKTIMFIFVMLMIINVKCTWAESEIQFASIPWLSNEIVTTNCLIEKGFLPEGSTPELTMDNGLYFIENDNLGYQPAYIPDFQEICLTASYHSLVKGKIAGYPLKSIGLSYAYDGEYKLISAYIDLIGAEYEAIKSKLTKVYGEGETRIIEEEGIISNLWKGDNNTAVLLYTESEGMSFTLIYGRLDAVDILSNCISEESDDISGL